MASEKVRRNLYAGSHFTHQPGTQQGCRHLRVSVPDGLCRTGLVFTRNDLGAGITGLLPVAGLGIAAVACRVCLFPASARDAAHRAPGPLGAVVPLLRAVRHTPVRRRLVPLLVGRLPFRRNRHALRLGSGGFLQRPRGTDPIPAYPGPGQLPGFTHYLRARQPVCLPVELLPESRQPDPAATAVHLF